MMAADPIVGRLCDLLAPFNEAGISLRPETDIAAELNIDSVAVMNFVMEVEDSFDIEIPLNVLSEIRSIADLAGVVRARIKRSDVA
jgi:acyl carrier protein